MHLAENEDKIVVFHNYENALEANVAKTKLDAYGIPCFLSNERVSSLYALPYMKGMEVRLHIFEKDWAQVKDLLSCAE